MIRRRHLLKMLLLTFTFSAAFILPLAKTQLAPSYTEHLSIVARKLKYAQSSNVNEAELPHDVVKLIQTLLELPSSVIQDKMMQSVESFLDQEATTGDVGVNYTISPLCLNHTKDTLVALVERQRWALSMLDAMGKPGPAIADFNIIWPGAYDYCRKILSNNTQPPFSGNNTQPPFSGKYCNAAFKVQQLLGPAAAVAPFGVVLGICIPDSCSSLDYTIVLNDALAPLYKLLNISIPAIVSCPAPKSESGLDTRAVVAIVICSIILFMMVLGTAVDIFLVQWPKWSFGQKLHPFAADRSFREGEVQPLLGQPDRAMTTAEPAIWVQVFVAFSVYTNGSKLLSTKQPPGSLTCVHGIRFLSMTWVVLGHSLSAPMSLSANFFPYAMELLKRWTFQVMANATVSVDTFFVLSGLLVTYLSLKEMKKRAGKLNWFLFYFHRFWRLTPAYMLLLMFYVCLYPYTGQGPFWPEDDKGVDNCKKNWWTNLLYVNNLVNPKEACFGHAWYLANDMQFYILSPLIFVPFYFSPLVGAISAGVFLLATSIAPGVITMHDHFGPSFFVQVQGYNGMSQGDYMSDFYIKPYNRMGPYVMGMLAGYFLYRTDCKLRISTITNLSIWGIATAAALAVVYGLYHATEGHPVTLPVSAFYNAVNRQVWGACVAWVVIACVTGNGGFVNTLLSWPGLIPLSRLTYCIYLLHIMVLELYVYSMNTVFYMSDINLVCFFLAVLVVSTMVAFVASLAFEAPMMGLEKIIFHRHRQPEVRAAGGHRQPTASHQQP